jgi:hypothetical protein
LTIVEGIHELESPLSVKFFFIWWRKNCNS